MLDSKRGLRKGTNYLDAWREPWKSSSPRDVRDLRTPLETASTLTCRNRFEYSKNIEGTVTVASDVDSDRSKELSRKNIVLQDTPQ